MMNFRMIFLTALFLLSQVLPAQTQKGYIPKIEDCPCLVKVDSSLKARCGYLVVPENRAKPAGRIVKIPFIYTLSPNPDKKKDVVLFTTGGPGYSTIVQDITPRVAFLKQRDFIVMDQRGTTNAIPCLNCSEVDTAIKRSYQYQLNKDSLVGVAVAICQKRLVAQGIDLSAYNTMESAADIEDLRLSLKIDSLDLFGISYSGGLMLTVARNFPSGVRSMVLNSPLPGFVNYEEDGLFNFNEALDQVFNNCEADSTNRALYGGLKERFRQYFTAINGKTFYTDYKETASAKVYPIAYTKNELLDVINDKLGSHDAIKEIPYIITQLISGKHQPYINDVIDGKFAGNKRLNRGMRYSVYCTEQVMYSQESLVKKQDLVLPWLSGYPFNNVNHAICAAWKVRTEPKEAKDPVYSAIPVLLAAGDADPWCRPFYNEVISRHMPYSQRLVIHNQTHTPNLKQQGVDYFQLFLDEPYKKLQPVKGVMVF